jgi:hypothetical protein
VPEEAEEPEQGEAHRCKLPLDRAPQQEDQSQALHTSNIYSLLYTLEVVLDYSWVRIGTI